jgi:hypothetical protein
MMKTAEQVERDVRPALQQQIGGDKSGAARPRAEFKHMFEHRRVRPAETHAQSVHRQIAVRRAPHFLEVTRGVELFQFRDRGAARREFKMVFVAEQAEGLQPQPGAAGALGLEGTIRRIAQRLDFG